MHEIRRAGRRVQADHRFRDQHVDRRRSMSERLELQGRSASTSTQRSAAKDGLKELVASTRDRFTLSELGQFGGSLPGARFDVESPVLVSSADGVGTKLKLAFATGRHDTVGQCLVNHCVNDILVQGARPHLLPRLSGHRRDGRATSCRTSSHGVAIGLSSENELCASGR